MTRTKNQHTNPALALRYFTDVNGKIWQYEQGCEAFSRIPEKTARIRNFYSPIDADGEYCDLVENDLFANLIENQIKSPNVTKSLYDKLLNGQFLSNNDRYNFALFIAAQYLRSPRVVNATAYFFAKEFWSRFHSELKKSKIKALNALDSTDFKIDVDSHAGLMCLSDLDDLAIRLMSMSWTLMKTEDHYFITSDHPVITDEKCAFTSLSSDTVLSFNSTEKEDDKCLVSKKDTQDLNEIIAENAYQYLYANQNDTEIQKLCRESSIKDIIINGDDIEIKPKLNNGMRLEFKYKGATFSDGSFEKEMEKIAKRVQKSFNKDLHFPMKRKKLLESFRKENKNE